MTVAEAKRAAQVEKMTLRNNILMYQATHGKHRYTPEELETKSLKQLKDIWEKIDKGAN